MKHQINNDEFTGFKEPGPMMVTIPKSEYDLLVQIKNKFLGENHEKAH